METLDDWSARPAHIRALPVLGGHLALDFANTVDDPEGPARFDHIADLRGYLGWALHADLLTEAEAWSLRSHGERRPEQAAAALGQAADLRTAINATFGALVEGDVTDAGWTLLRPFVSGALARADLTGGATGPELAWSRTALDSPLGPVAAAAHRLLVAPDLRRLKRCAGCPWLFLDASKNGSRRWCSMTDCGTHAKVVRFVARRAERRRSGPPG